MKYDFVFFFYLRPLWRYLWQALYALALLGSLPALLHPEIHTGIVIWVFWEQVRHVKMQFLCITALLFTAVSSLKVKRGSMRSTASSSK